MTIKADGWEIFSGIAGCLSVLPGKELMDTYGKELEYFCTRILLCSSMGRISRVRDRKLRKSLREETFVFLREISGVSEEPLSGQWTERALSADRHTGIVRDLWGNHRQMQAGRVTGIENGGQRKGENMRISVAMATYNGARFITEQLDSIRLQSLPVDQVILRDDGSSDQTLEIVREYLETYELAPAWRITQNGKRLGYAENFRAAVEETDGDYVFSAIRTISGNRTGWKIW